MMDNKLKFMNGHNCINIDPNELKEAPFRANDPDNPDSNNGLITSIWGPPEWESFHAKTFGYPIKPSDEQKSAYLQYFILEGDVLPCIFCRTSYKKFINEGDTILDMSVMESRETLTKWGLRIHNAVNKKLGVDYGDTYEELCYKYDSYRAKCTKTEKGCLMPVNMKAKSYQKADIHRAPIIDVKYSLALSEHAKTLGLNNYNSFVQYYSSLVRNTDEWGRRDCVARKVIRYMRKNGVNALDSNGLPSSYEMMLISMMCSTLEHEKLEAIFQQISKKNPYDS
jgi:hypothetical protein